MTVSVGNFFGDPPAQSVTFRPSLNTDAATIVAIPPESDKGSRRPPLYNGVAGRGRVRRLLR